MNILLCCYNCANCFRALESCDIVGRTSHHHIHSSALKIFFFCFPCGVVDAMLTVIFGCLVLTVTMSGVLAGS